MIISSSHQYKKVFLFQLSPPSFTFRAHPSMSSHFPRLRATRGRWLHMGSVRMEAEYTFTETGIASPPCPREDEHSHTSAQCSEHGLPRLAKCSWVTHFYLFAPSLLGSISVGPRNFLVTPVVCLLCPAHVALSPWRHPLILPTLSKSSSGDTRSTTLSGGDMGNVCSKNGHHITPVPMLYL